MTDETFQKIKAGLQFDARGFIPAIIQDAKTRKVLTLCYLNEAALKETLTKKMVYVFRRSLNKLMQKGESSGHTQAVKEFRVDCEGKSILFVVDQKIAGCHKGYFSCYFEKVDDEGKRRATEDPVFDPKKVYK